LPQFQRDGLYIFAPQEGQMSLVSLITSGLLDEFPKLQFIFTEAGTSFIKPLVQWLDRVLERLPVDYDDQEEPLSNRPLTKVGERLRRARALLPAHIFLEKNQSLQVTISRITFTSQSRRKSRSLARRSNSWEPSGSFSRLIIRTTIRAAE
jgi:hypothetical protein